MHNRKIINNASWIIGCKIAQSLLSFLISILTARYLGPSNYGLINYAASIILFATPIAQLGVGNVLVQEIVYNPKEEGRIVGTTLLLSVLSSFACIAGVFSFTLIANPGEKVTFVVVALYSIVLLLQGADLLRYWFQAHYIAKYYSIVAFFAFFIVSVYKIVLLIKGASIYWFAISNSFDAVIILIALLVLYKEKGGSKLGLSKAIASRLVNKSKYYIVADIMIVIFTQTDRVMLKIMLNDAATGYYAVAASFAGVANFVYAAIIDSVRPAIFENKTISEKQYKLSVSQLYCVIIYLSLALSLIIAILSPALVRYAYGEQYYSASNILRILVWYTTFSYIGMVRNIWILAENKQKYIIGINSIGAILNVFLNYCLIPHYGASGAAFSSVLTQLLMNVVATFFIKPLRESIILMIKGLNPKCLHSFLFTQ